MIDLRYEDQRIDSATTKAITTNDGTADFEATVNELQEALLSPRFLPRPFWKRRNRCIDGTQTQRQEAAGRQHELIAALGEEEPFR